MEIGDQHWDGGLHQAFGPAEEGESVLDRIQRLHGAGTSVLLRETEQDVAPVLIPRHDDDDARDDLRYQILGEIARGGIGVVYRGRDKDLNRDVALKVLRPEFTDRSDVVQRFVEEAQVGGQLQHPGIVPIYGLGLQVDGRPCFAMRLIKGETLAELLDDNPKGIDLLSVFEQVAQTMAYAHSRGVIHRDLKPANVMVGAFGEVQVVDWGFAKVLGRKELTPRPAEQTVIATVRSAGEGSQSMAGSVMGTPAYMPPEQAMGRIDELDERADVFALGAILCEILTGQPPYTGEPRDVLVAATQSRLDEAYARLDACEAADGLNLLVRDCLEPLSAKRPRNARRVAERFADHLASVEEEARRAELDALASVEESARQRHGRRRTLVLAGLVLFALLVAGGGYGTWKRGRDARLERAAPLIATALREATAHEGRRDWAAAAAVARRAVDIAASEGVDDAGAAAMLAAFEEKRDAAAAERALVEADARFLAELEEARAQGADHYSMTEIDAEFEAALARRFPSGVVDTERLRASPDAQAFAAAFDGWAQYRRSYSSLSEKDWKQVEAWAREIDPENNELRDAMLQKDPAGLEAMVRELELTALSTGMINSLGRTLRRAARYESALALLERAHLLHPDDFWIHFRLAGAARRAGELDRAIQHYTAAIGIRPQSREARHYLGVALQMAGDLDGALVAYRDALALETDWDHGIRHIADLLHARGKTDEAVEVFRQAMAAHPEDYDIGEELGMFQRDVLGDTDEAIATFRSGIALVPGEAWPYSSIGKALNKAGRFDEAIVELERAIGIDPEYVWPYVHLATALVGKGDVQAAEQALDRARGADAEHWRNYAKLASRLANNGHHEAAVRMVRKAAGLAPPDSAEACAEVGEVCFLTGVNRYPDAMEVLKESVVWYRKAVDLAPWDTEYWTALGKAQNWSGDQDGAVSSFQRALELDPANLGAQYLLADAFDAKGDWQAAVRGLRAQIRRRPQAFQARYHLANLLAVNGAADAAEAILRDGIAVSPRLALPRIQYCNLLAWRLRAYDRAIAEWRKAIELHPRNLQIRSGLGVLLKYLRRHDEAIELYEEVIAIAPAKPMGYFQVGHCLWRAERAAEAVPYYEKVIEVDPDAAEGRCNLGKILRELGRWDESLRWLREGHELGSPRSYWKYPSGAWLRNAERMVELVSVLERVIEGVDVEVTADESVLIAEMLSNRGHFELSARFYQQGFDEAPELREFGSRHWDAIQAAARGGEASHPLALAWCRSWLEWAREDLKERGHGTVTSLFLWKVDPTVSELRALKHTSPEWKRLWADIDVLIEDAHEVLRR